MSEPPRPDPSLVSIQGMPWLMRLRRVSRLRRIRLWPLVCDVVEAAVNAQEISNDLGNSIGALQDELLKGKRT